MFSVPLRRLATRSVAAVSKLQASPILRFHSSRRLLWLRALSTTKCFCSQNSSRAFTSSVAAPQIQESSQEHYTSLLQTNLKSGAIDRALTVLQEMQSVGVSADTVSTNSLIRALCKVGRIDDALSLLDIMRDLTEKGAGPNEVTYIFLIDGCLRWGKLHAAANLYFETKALGVALDLLCYEGLIQSLGPTNTPLALDIFESLKNQGLAPSAAIYFALVRVLIGNDSLEQASALLETMDEEGKVRFSLEMFESLLELLPNELDARMEPIADRIMENFLENHMHELEGAEAALGEEDDESDDVDDDDSEGEEEEEEEEGEEDVDIDFTDSDDDESDEFDDDDELDEDDESNFPYKPVTQR